MFFPVEVILPELPSLIYNVYTEVRERIEQQLAKEAELISLFLQYNKILTNEFIISDSRNCLKPQSVDYLVFLTTNLWTYF